MDKGVMSGRASLAFLGSIDASADLKVSETLFILIAENVLRDSSAQHPEEAAKSSASGLIQELMAANIMLREDGAFKSSATYKHGILTVNGHKLDLSHLR